MAEEASIREKRFGVCDKTIDELFGMIMEGSLPVDPHPIDVRRRATALADMVVQFLYEKTVSTQAHGKLQVALWNNLIEGVKAQLEACELVHQSLCNEARVTRYLP